MRTTLKWRTTLLVLMIASSVCGGCATIVKGSSQGITVKTNPSGANCELTRQGKAVGVVNSTPGMLQVGKGGYSVDVTCKKAGHLDATAKIPSSFQGWTLGNLLIGGIVGIVVDAGSGAMHEYQPEISMRLLPENFASIQSRDHYFDIWHADVKRQSESAKAELASKCPKSQCEKLLKTAQEKTEELLAEVESSRQRAVIAPTAAEPSQPLQPLSHIDPIAIPAISTPSQAVTRPDAFLKIGDRWKYAFSDRGKGAGFVTVEILDSGERKVRERFTREGYKGFVAERDVEVVFSPDRFLTPIAFPGGYLLSEIAPYIPPGTELKAGQIWDGVPGLFFIADTGKVSLVSQVRVVRQESVKVPAGDFASWRIETESETSVSWSHARIKCTFWYSPQMKRTIKMKIDTIATLTANSGSESYELASFDAGKQ